MVSMPLVYKRALTKPATGVVDLLSATSPKLEAVIVIKPEKVVRFPSCLAFYFTSYTATYNNLSV
jgi:hypothetical protein